MTASAKRRMDATVFALALGRLRIHSNGRRNRGFEAASMVMVDGCSVAQAARICGVRNQTVFKAMKRIEAVFENMGICAYCGRRAELAEYDSPSTR